ncbi:MAG TPA: hypothetical protein VFN75_05595, partial [Pseudonocardiaceae bacterium]|nr:hypothetical protein [Pseudonocardiaceae bacterium]
MTTPPQQPNRPAKHQPQACVPGPPTAAMALTLFYRGSISGPPERWISGDPRQLWPRETTHLHP